ncbi:MAG: hypothetical protein GF421_04965 [Candidatus Aminicenantes bacterium]|nr:hypothetical protein [Candidatus Aminicenantes bacterium]
MFDQLKKVLAAPFQNAASINRNVMLDYLRKLKGRFLELGPGKAPLLESLDHINDQDKMVIELKEATSYCRSLGYMCLEQDMGKEKWAL